MPVGAEARTDPAIWHEFRFWRAGVEHALTGGLWLHRHTWRGVRMAHLVSSDLARLEWVGLTIGLHPTRLQYRPLRDPRTGTRTPAWHWDLVGPWVPPESSR